MEHFSGDNVVKHMKEIKAQLEKPAASEQDVEQASALLEELLIIVEDIDCAKGAILTTKGCKSSQGCPCCALQLVDDLVHLGAHQRVCIRCMLACLTY